MRRVLLVGLVPWLLGAGPFTLWWEMGRQYAADTFVLMAKDITTQAQTTLTVEASAPGACGLPDPDMYCAEWPSCPQEGALEIRIQAVAGDQRSRLEDSPLLVCVFAPSAPCQCLRVSTVVPERPAVPIAPPVPPPGGDTMPPSSTGRGPLASVLPAIQSLPTLPALAPTPATPT